MIFSVVIFRHVCNQTIQENVVEKFAAFYQNDAAKFSLYFDQRHAEWMIIEVLKLGVLNKIFVSFFTEFVKSFYL